LNRSLSSGERQVATTLTGIRYDHRARYAWAAKALPEASRVLDIACGIGYGTKMLAQAGHDATGADISEESIEFARAHYAHKRAQYRVADACALDQIEGFEAAVSFETIEHVVDPRPLLLTLRRECRILLASVPNEEIWPYVGQTFHFRHYRPHEFESLLKSCGWNVVEWCKQNDTQSDVIPGKDGHTLVVRCV
jgi:2-polyprenyl-3-methyl-5-hydroxy-6-metoxy-1,4-benzoquinol methylase